MGFLSRVVDSVFMGLIRYNIADHEANAGPGREDKRSGAQRCCAARTEERRFIQPRSNNVM